MDRDIEQHIKNLRMAIKALAGEVKASHEHPVFEKPNAVMDDDEMHANLTLAYRHLEDAAMRLGKVVQAFDGGKSVYDLNPKAEQ
jgi:hypothetical protein